MIRAALQARGWVERRLPHPVPKPAGHCHGEEDGEDGDDSNDDNGKTEALHWASTLGLNTFVNPQSDSGNETFKEETSSCEVFCSPQRL